PFGKAFERMGIQSNEVARTVGQVASTSHETNHAIERIAVLSSQVQNRMVTMNDQVVAVRDKSERLQEMLAALRTGNTPFDALAAMLDSLQSACKTVLLQARNQGADIFDQQSQRI